MATIVNTFARGLDRTQVHRFGPVTEEAHERLPVFANAASSDASAKLVRTDPVSQLCGSWTIQHEADRGDQP